MQFCLGIASSHSVEIESLLMQEAIVKAKLVFLGITLWLISKLNYKLSLKCSQWSSLYPSWCFLQSFQLRLWSNQVTFWSSVSRFYIEFFTTKTCDWQSASCIILIEFFLSCNMAQPMSRWNLSMSYIHIVQVIMLPMGLIGDWNLSAMNMFDRLT